eukprot:SAG31_NODE_2160_length_6297_cov_4.924015_6_plen_124_part_00
MTFTYEVCTTHTNLNPSSNHSRDKTGTVAYQRSHPPTSTNILTSCRVRSPCVTISSVEMAEFEELKKIRVVVDSSIYVYDALGFAEFVKDATVVLGDNVTTLKWAPGAHPRVPRRTFRLTSLL